MIKYIQRILPVLISFFVFSTNTLKAQTPQEIANHADTSKFSIANSSWKLLNGYVGLNQSQDSVRLQLILLNDSGVINWDETDQYIGAIKVASLRPTTERILTYQLVPMEFQLTVKTNGECVLKWTGGHQPAITANTVLPLIIDFLL